MMKIFCSCLLIMVYSFAAAQNNATFSGKITDEKHNPVDGATIYLLNTNIAAVSGADGNFNIKNIDDGTYTAVINAIGFASQNVPISTKNRYIAEFTIILHEQANNLDDVIVSTQKREELLQQVPVSITAISAKEVSQYRLWDTKELTAIAPNTYSANSGDDRNITSIRGIATTSYDPAVATYIDGVNQFSLDTYIANLMDVERIEIARGPQGTLYGRNAMGGVINIITKQPTNTTEGFAELNAGNYGQQRYTLGFRIPLVKNKLFLGASGMFDKREGFYTNEFNNTSFDDQQGIAGNYYLKFIPNAKWTVSLNLKHRHNTSKGAFPLVYGVEDAINDPYKVNQDATAKMIDNTLNTSLSVSHTGKGFNFASQTGWQQNYRYYNAPLDADFSPIDAVSVINNYGNKWNNVQVLTEELRFTSPSGKNTPLQWIAGAYFFHQDNPTKQAIHYGKDAGLIGVPDINFSTINTTTAKNTGIALYGQMTYALGKKLELTGGLRFDYENKKLMIHGDYVKDGEQAFITQPDTSATLNFNAISPKIGISYHAAANTNLFASYSRGYRTGGLTQLSSDPSQPPLYPYKPEYSNAVEAGIKNTLLQNRLRLNISAFITTVQDVQVPTLILPDAITITKNTGKLISKGFELEAAATPAKGLQLDYSFGYTDAKYSSLKISQNGAEVDLDDKKQIYTPDITSMLAVQYGYTVSQKNRVQVVVRGEWFYLGKQYFDLANSLVQNPYSLLNARAGVASKKVDVFFWARNIAGKKYASYAYDFGAVHLGDPATFGITLSLRMKSD